MVEGSVTPKPGEGRPKAIGMISGGLDSSLAVRMMQSLGFEVKAVSFYTGFCITETHRRMGGRPRDGAIPRSEPLYAAAEAGVEVELVDISDEYVDIVTNPRFGYGANMNPCIDCRIFMMKKAKEIMEAEGAELVFTGEVLGQRPKSQRRDTLRLIERESGLEGRILRPLSGRHLPPTVAEKDGLIRREDLLSIKGRGRREQIRLAEKLGLLEYPQPAGGCCFLTDESYSRRFRDLIENRDTRRYTKDDVVLLATGRHFRIGPGEKLIVARTDGENLLLERYAKERWSLRALEHKGPLALCEGSPEHQVRHLASRIVARYGKGRDEKQVRIGWVRGEESFELHVEPFDDDALIEPYRL